MKLLGIDYGRRKIGLAVSDGSIAEPWKVIRYEKKEEALRRLALLLKEESLQKVVLGISEGIMGQETKEFGRTLKAELNVAVVFQDETLSTQMAHEFSIGAGIKRKKRKEMEDAYSAAIILQTYIDSNR